MKRLILMRHGKTERSHPGGDVERRLTDRGRNDAGLMGRLLADEALAPDLALVSAATRTQQTWDELAPAFPKAESRVLKALYHAAADQILFEVEAVADEADTIMIVGHNPGLHELTLVLLRQGGAGSALMARAESRFPTATVAAFTFDEAGRPVYDGLFYAADHGGGGGE
ncbi:SixA phosphatase family protein [Caulobacter mirabilis]|uniref:Phosphohistidine phosphatase n=1 Tax=Caulobacter mirabilis TaxID=69666 RepID=A0A2D2AUM5_9CAUL|nr:histidine phosphatase family protein [Caulobacter mirabilis]ATQ41708.1 phosphohistidine phosphatase [Caulobacter mirabilis]